MTGTVLKGDVKGLLGLGVLDIKARDVTLGKHDARDGDQDLRGRHGDLGLVCRVRVADARQHVRNGIGNLHWILFSFVNDEPVRSVRPHP